MALPHLNVIAVDGIPEMTEIADLYLKERGVLNARAVPLPSLRAQLRSLEHPPRLAIACHVFPELSPTAVEAWLGLFKEERVQYVFVSSNTPGLRSVSQSQLTPSPPDVTPHLFL